MRLFKNITLLFSCLALLAACGNGAESASPAQEAQPEEIVLSQSTAIEAIPQSVKPYARGEAVRLADLTLKKKGDQILGQASYTLAQEGDFTLVVYASTPEQLLVVYLDQEMALTLVFPKGTVLFGMGGYELTGGDTGTLEFSFAAKTSGAYDVTGEKATVSIFAVPGTVNPRSTLPGDQENPAVYEANSNVLQVDSRF